MPRSADRATRATRDAANASAGAVAAFALLWLLSTQASWIRAWSPFAEDPWDAVMTYAAIFLPFVGNRNVCFSAELFDNLPCFFIGAVIAN